MLKNIQPTSYIDAKKAYLEATENNDMKALWVLDAYVHRNFNIKEGHYPLKVLSESKSFLDWLDIIDYLCVGKLLEGYNQKDVYKVFKDDEWNNDTLRILDMFAQEHYDVGDSIEHLLAVGEISSPAAWIQILDTNFKKVKMDLNESISKYVVKIDYKDDNNLRTEISDGADGAESKRTIQVGAHNRLEIVYDDYDSFKKFIAFLDTKHVYYQSSNTF
jgi:hypothetical protein